MGRLLALDYGKKRTGIAVTDEFRLIASGLTTVDTQNLIAFLTDYLGKEKVDIFIIGLPKKLNNQPSESETLIQAFIPKLKTAFPSVPIIRVDERFTSKMAIRTMIDSGLRKNQRRNKALIDEISATLILQSYLQTL